MQNPSELKKLISFDGSTTAQCSVYLPDRYKNLEGLFSDFNFYTARGAGLSYPALSFAQDSKAIDMSNWSRVLVFDQAECEIEVEAGMTLGELANLTIPKGFFLKVQPGHPSISIGGCLAADVHGKNQYLDGNFKEQVLSFSLYHPINGYIRCSRVENTELFDLTCGGWGLTGVILGVRLKLSRIQSRTAIVETTIINSFSELVEQLKSKAEKSDLLFSWHNCLTQKKWGHGYIKSASIAQAANTSEAIGRGKDFNFNWKELSADKRGFRFSLASRCFFELVNVLFFSKEKMNISNRRQDLVNFLFPVLDKTHYFDTFGKAGFLESQVLIPEDFFSDLMLELQKAQAKFNVTPTLASCKLFRGKPELLRFYGSGIVLALNFSRCSSTNDFMKYWDDMAASNGLLPNLTKDSRIGLNTVQKCYSEYEKFKTMLCSWDPKRVFRNELSERLLL